MEAEILPAAGPLSPAMAADSPRPATAPSRLGAWLGLLRLEYQGNNLLAWFAATLLALPAGGFRADWFLGGLLMLLLAQCALELLDGYHDFVQGAHPRKAIGEQRWTGGSGVLASGSVRPKLVERVAWTLGLLSGVCFVAVTIGRTGWVGLAVGLFGAVCGAGWAMPPLKLSYRGLGEPAIALVAGPLMTAQAWLIARGQLDATALWLGVPLGLVELAMAMAHGMVDAQVDAQAGKRTLAVRLGPRASAQLHVFALVAAFASLLLLVGTQVLPKLALLALLALPLALRSAWVVLAAARDPQRLPEVTRGFPGYGVHAVMGLGLVGAFAIKGSAAPYAPLVIAGFGLCYLPVGLTLLMRGSEGSP